MNSNPLIKRALGSDWNKLPPVIQRHYQLSSADNSSSVVYGSLRVNYPAFVRPILVIARSMGALADLRGDAIRVTVKKWITETSPALNWSREFQASDGRTTIFASQMEYQQANELVEFVGFGFGIRLGIFVDKGRLIYQSKGYLWRYGSITVPIPEVFFLGHATIIETPIDEDKFELDFKITHPLFGQTYEYGGVLHLNETKRSIRRQIFVRE